MVSRENASRRQQVRVRSSLCCASTQAAAGTAVTVGSAGSLVSARDAAWGVVAARVGPDDTGSVHNAEDLYSLAVAAAAISPEVAAPAGVLAAGDGVSSGSDARVSNATGSFSPALQPPTPRAPLAAAAPAAAPVSFPAGSHGSPAPAASAVAAAGALHSAGSAAEPVAPSPVALSRTRRAGLHRDHGYSISTTVSPSLIINSTLGSRVSDIRKVGPVRQIRVIAAS